MNLLEVRNLEVTFRQSHAVTHAVAGVDFEIAPAEVLALVGESGSGKSVSALAIARLLGPSAEVTGSITFEGQEIGNASEKDLQKIRGRDIGYIFQEPMTSLNPLHTIEKQLTEALRLHGDSSAKERRTRSLELLEKVGIDRGEERLKSYPHQLSGGQRQRVMIAMALANRPKLLIADEPTTALDVTIEAQIIDLLKSLVKEFGLSMLFITHDLNVVRRLADRVVVMHNARVVETGSTDQVLGNPQKDYTKRLVNARPEGAPHPVEAGAQELMNVSDLRVAFEGSKGWFTRKVSKIEVVHGLNLAVKHGETLGLVGESGSGKSSTALALCRLIHSEGDLRFDAQDMRKWSRQKLRAQRSDIQFVFQDPFGSLSPRMTVAQIIAEGLEVHRPGRDYEAEVIEIMQELGLDPAMRTRYPHEFSGGQRQRIAIARAMVLNPRLVFLDEPTSALDRTVQLQIIERLRYLQAQRGLAYVFISHDLDVVRAMSHRIMVMQNGVVVEEGSTEEIFENPQHPYTKTLLAASLMGHGV